ncbi:MAG: hypothetical protein L3J41_17730, partial [Melioribacteraceae bacterium]|nr:hypothetical protein [Melioribacteraceae bacterium]
DKPAVAPGAGQAMRKAKKFGEQLCRNRDQFKDDGNSNRYKCGKDNQRCDSVTITVVCDAQFRRLMEKGIGPDNPPRWPNGRPGVIKPNKFSKKFCNTKITLNCLDSRKKRRKDGWK